MKIDVKFTEETFPVKFDDGEKFKANFGEVSVISTGITQEEAEAMAAESRQEGYTEGQAAGYAEGYSKGEADGYGTGVTDGKQAEYDAFWDAIQEKGTKSNYNYHFQGESWTDAMFKPKYPTMNGTLSYAFRNSAVTDASACTFISVGGMSYAFQNSAIEKVGVIKISTSNQALNSTFRNCKNLRIVELIDLCSEITYLNTISYSNTFAGCGELAEIRFDGKINNNISFVNSPQLTHDSLMSIINALSNATASRKLTLGSTNIAKLTTEELDQIEAKGWTYA